MKNIPYNQEHIEARQSEIDKDRNDFVSSLPKEDQDKFKAVEEACNILLKAKVDFYLFPVLKDAKKPTKERSWQWNSLSATVEYDSEGKVTKKCAERGIFINNNILYTIGRTFADDARSIEDGCSKIAAKLAIAATVCNTYLDNE